MIQTVKTARLHKGREKIKSTETSEHTPMWFGRYEGWPLAAVPPDYLLWLYHNIRKLDPELKKWIASCKRHFSTQLHLAR